MEKGMSVALCKPHKLFATRQDCILLHPTLPNLFFSVSKTPLIASLPAYNTPTTTKLSPEAWKPSWLEMVASLCKHSVAPKGLGSIPYCSTVTS